MSRTSTGSSSRRELGAGVPERPDEVRAALASLGVRPSRALGQSFLVDPFVADAEAAVVETAAGRPVVEIGGGLGALTAALLRRGLGPVTVVERDPRLARYLRRVFEGRVEVLEGDAQVVPLPSADAVVGNLPYSVATPILLAQMARRVPRLVFLVQEEVAQRLAALPGSKQYGRLSLIAQLYGSVELFRRVAPEAFYPAPEVTSRLGVHRAREGPLPVPSIPEFEQITRALFSSRRKQLGNLLPRLTTSEREAVRLAEAAGWPDGWRSLRPEEIPPEQYFALARAVHAR